MQFKQKPNNFVAPKKQGGVALTLLIIIIALAIGSYIYSQLSLTEIKLKKEARTLKALEIAKEALLNYALIEADLDSSRTGLFGFLPCPDYNSGLSEGVQDGNCGSVNVSQIGWLPWKTLDLPDLADASGTCLMYAVSGNYKQSLYETEMLNEDTNGQFQIVDDTGTTTIGVQPEDRIVAIVFAPGNVLGGQNRIRDTSTQCGQDYANEQAYLEGDGATDNSDLSSVADSIDQFIHATESSENLATPFNDWFVTISREEIWSKITQRNDFIDRMTNLTQALALCITEYNNTGNNSLPWPAPLTLTDYRDITEYSDTVMNAGRVPFEVDESNAQTGETVADLFKSTGCSNLTLSIGPVTADLNSSADEYRQLWDNWKDHFFYVLSEDFKPSSIPVTDCAGNCITVGGTEYSGIVFFSGSRQPGVTRNSPPIDTDEKSVIANYLENGNDAVFSTTDGIADAFMTSATNDIMFCISGTLPFTVSQC